MKKKLAYLTIIILSLPFFIALILSVSSSNELFDLHAEFSKVILVAPSSASILQELFFQNKNIINNKAIEIDGNYSINYESRSTKLLVSKGPMILKDLQRVQVHQIETFQNATNNADIGLIDVGSSSEMSDVQFIQNDDNLYGVYINGPIDISSPIHEGTFFLLAEAVPFNETGIPSVLFIDDNFTKTVTINAILNPSDDPAQRTTIMPDNNFEIRQNNDKNLIQSSTVFKGLLNTDYNFITARTLYTSRLDSQSDHFILSGLGLPSMIGIDGESINSVRINGFTGWYQIFDDDTIQKIGSQNWEIRDVKKSNVTIEVKSAGESSEVLVKVNFKGKVGNLIINDKELRNFKTNFLRNLFVIYTNSYYEGILILVIGLLLGSWFKERQ